MLSDYHFPLVSSGIEKLLGGRCWLGNFTSEGSSDSARGQNQASFKDEELLAYTLVPLVVLEVALGAATPVASDDVLAAMLTAVVTLTLVHICKRSRGSREFHQQLSLRLSEASSICL